MGDIEIKIETVDSVCNRQTDSLDRLLQVPNVSGIPVMSAVPVKNSARSILERRAICELCGDRFTTVSRSLKNLVISCVSKSSVFCFWTLSLSHYFWKHGRKKTLFGNARFFNSAVSGLNNHLTKTHQKSAEVLPLKFKTPLLIIYFL